MPWNSAEFSGCSKAVPTFRSRNSDLLLERRIMQDFAAVNLVTRTRRKALPSAYPFPSLLLFSDFCAAAFGLMRATIARAAMASVRGM